MDWWREKLGGSLRLGLDDTTLIRSLLHISGRIEIRNTVLIMYTACFACVDAPHDEQSL